MLLIGGECAIGVDAPEDDRDCEVERVWGKTVKYDCWTVCNEGMSSTLERGVPLGVGLGEAYDCSADAHKNADLDECDEQKTIPHRLFIVSVDAVSDRADVRGYRQWWRLSMTPNLTEQSSSEHVDASASACHLSLSTATPLTSDGSTVSLDSVEASDRPSAAASPLRSREAGLGETGGVGVHRSSMSDVDVSVRRSAAGRYRGCLAAPLGAKLSVVTSAPVLCCVDADAEVDVDGCSVDEA